MTVKHAPRFDLDAEYLAILTDVPDLSAHVPVVDVDDPTRFAFLADPITERLLDAGATRAARSRTGGAR